MNSNEISYNIILLMGLAIFIYSFLPQVISIYKSKDTLGVVPSSWLMNYIGRMMWIPFSIFNGGMMGLVMLLGQGIIAALNIPIVYYAYRNKKNRGIYLKEHFKKILFTSKILLIIFTLLMICFGVMFQQRIININLENVSDQFILILGILTTFITAIAFLPQTLKVIKTKNTVSIVLRTTMLFAIGNSLAVISLIMKASFNYDAYFTKLIGSIILGSVSTGLMYIISVVKIINILKKRKIIFMFDLDGTLFEDNSNNLPSLSKDFLIKLNKNGYKLAANTERPYMTIEHLFTKQIWNLFKFVSGNSGAYVKNNKEILKYQIDNEFVKNFIIENSDLNLLISTEKSIYTNKKLKKDGNSETFRNNFYPLSDFNSKREEVFNICLTFDDAKKAEDMLNLLKDKYSSTHLISMTENMSITITKQEVDKSNIVKKLLRNGNKVIYFGNSENDLLIFNMDNVIKVTPSSSCMAIKNKANFVLNTNNNESIAIDLNKLNL